MQAAGAPAPLPLLLLLSPAILMPSRLSLLVVNFLPSFWSSVFLPLSRSTLESLPVPAPSRLSLTTRGRNSTYSLDPNRCSGLIYANLTINVFPCLCSLVSSSFSPPKHRSALLLSQSREALVRCFLAGLLACLREGPPNRTTSLLPPISLQRAAGPESERITQIIIGGLIDTELYSTRLNGDAEQQGDEIASLSFRRRVGRNRTATIEGGARFDLLCEAAHRCAPQWVCSADPTGFSACVTPFTPLYFSPPPLTIEGRPLSDMETSRWLASP